MARFLDTKFPALHATILFCVCTLAMPAHAADDFSALFDENFKGIELALPSADEMLANRPTSVEFAAPRLLGMPLSMDDLSLVLRATHPFGSSIPGDARDIEKETIRQRFVEWIMRRSDKSEEFNVFSALMRTPDETGMRVDFDADTEEVRLEYRVGF